MTQEEFTFVVGDLGIPIVIDSKAELIHWKSSNPPTNNHYYFLPDNLFENKFINFKYGITMKRDLLDGN